MAKETGKTKESAQDIKSIERYVNFSIRGNGNQVPSTDPDFRNMVNDHTTYLSDKEFLEKWYDKKKFSGMHVDEEFEENGSMEEFRVTEEYYITFKDDSEIYIDFNMDGDFMNADIRNYEEAKGKMAEKWLPEFQNNEGWNMDIDSLVEEVSGKKVMGKGGLTPAKARQILHDGEANGKPITEKQRRYFGAVASGYAKKEKGGKAGGKGSSFLGDEGVMIDFWEMPRDEFIESSDYSEADYDATLDEYLSGVVVFDNSKEPEGRYTILNKETGDVFSVAEYPKQDAVAGQLSHNVTDRQNITFGYGWKKGHDEKGLRGILMYEEDNWINEMTDNGEIGEKVKDLNLLPEAIKEYIKKIQSEGKKMARGGKIGSGMSKFWSGFGDDGALITGGSYFSTEKKDFGGTVLGILFGGTLGWMFGASSKQRGYPKKLKRTTDGGEEKLYKWGDGDSGWIKMSLDEYMALTSGNLYKYDHKKDIWKLAIFEKGGKAEARVITFADGFQFREVTFDYAKQNWKKESIYEIMEDEETEHLVEDESGLSESATYGVEMGFKKGKGGSIHHKKYAQKHVGMTKRGRGIDSKVPAKKAGWRKSKETGNWYFESRKNRSDANPKKKI